MKKPSVIAFANQKGGAGKSTIGVHVASALTYLYGYKVLVIDCDYPQNSIRAYRMNDQAKLKIDEVAQARFLKQATTPFPIHVCRMEDVVEYLDDALSNNSIYDFILVDTPGTINLEDLPALLLRINYIFSPLKADIGSIASTISYVMVVRRFLKANNPQSDLLGVYAFWNLYDKRVKKTIFIKTNKKFEEKNLPMLNSRVELLKVIEDGRSTLFPIPDKKLSELGLGSLIDEILLLIVGKGVTTPSGRVINFVAQVFEEAGEAAPSNDDNVLAGLSE